MTENARTKRGRKWAPFTKVRRCVYVTRPHQKKKKKTKKKKTRCSKEKEYEKTANETIHDKGKIRK